MLIIFRPTRAKIINIMSVLRTFWAIFDSHRGNVNNFGPHDPQIINITSVLRTFWEIIDSNRRNVNILGLMTPKCLTVPVFYACLSKFWFPWTEPTHLH